MQIILDHEGITIQKGYDWTTFYWLTLLLTFKSSKHGKVFITPLHYLWYSLTQWWDAKKASESKRCKDSYSSGALSFYHMTTAVLNAETDKGSDNFAILLNTSELREFLSMTKDYKAFEPGQTEGILAVVRSSSAENLANTVKALDTVGALVVAQVYDGVEASDH